MNQLSEQKPRIIVQDNGIMSPKAIQDHQGWHYHHRLSVQGPRGGAEWWSTPHPLQAPWRPQVQLQPVLVATPPERQAANFDRICVAPSLPTSQCKGPGHMAATQISGNGVVQKSDRLGTPAQKRCQPMTENNHRKATVGLCTEPWE